MSENSLTPEKSYCYHIECVLTHSASIGMARTRGEPRHGIELCKRVPLV